jgi:hypothetical protein
MVIGGQPALSSGRARKGFRAGKGGNFRSPPARRWSGIQFQGCSGLPRKPGRTRGEGSPERSRQEAPEEMIVSPPQAGSSARDFRAARKTDRPKKGRERTDGGRTGRDWLARIETGGGYRTGPRHGEDASARKGGNQAEARTGTAGAERHRARVFGPERGAGRRRQSRVEAKGGPKGLLRSRDPGKEPRRLGSRSRPARRLSERARIADGRSFPFGTEPRHETKTGELQLGAVGLGSNAGPHFCFPLPPPGRAWTLLTT